MTGINDGSSQGYPTDLCYPGMHAAACRISPNKAGCSEYQLMDTVQAAQRYSLMHSYLNSKSQWFIRSCSTEKQF